MVTHIFYYSALLLNQSMFIHSFILAIYIAPLQVLYYSEALPTTALILYRSFTPKRTGNRLGKGLAQGLYLAARAGVEPTTLRLKAIDSIKAPPCPTMFGWTRSIMALHKYVIETVLSSRVKMNRLLRFDRASVLSLVIQWRKLV